MEVNGGPTLRTLERLAPGAPIRQGLERIMQQGKGAIIVLGGGPLIEAISSGGFALHQPVSFSPAKLSELSKMDGGIVLDAEGDHILAANVHFVPSNEIPSDETGSRHRTAQRVAIQTGFPVVAVSDSRKIATVYVEGRKIELRSPTEVAARVNQELQTLDRLRRRLDEAEAALTQLELTSLSTYRAAVTLIQRAELVRRVGMSIEREAVSLGDEGRLAFIQLSDMVRGVSHIRDVTVRDYLPTRRQASFVKAVAALKGLEESDLEDPTKVARALGLTDLENPVTPRGYRMLSKVGRLPEQVRDELIRHFRTLPKMISASAENLEQVEGIGSARAAHLRHYFDRLQTMTTEWGPPAM